ncbi:MAG: AAA family ATPase [Chromatiales bacterium]|nr:AAA family ATPase [Chromatiales bacterium]
MWRAMRCANSTGWRAESMRLLELSVRHYRLHEALTVVFDPHRNVIAGPNEAGKSTLMEALQRVLFLPAKGNTALHRAMRPAHGGGIPEVVLRFEAGGQEYRLLKRYAKGAGQVSLARVGGNTVTDQAAEEALQALLGEPNGKPEHAWAHILVEQGRSAEDPTGFANAYRQDLVAQFQASGGAIVQQSARDAAVSAKLTEKVGEWFTRQARPRAGSPLAEAESALAEAQRVLQDSEGRFEQREAASRRHAEASARIATIETEQAELSRELEQATTTARSIEALQAKLEEQTRALEEAERTYAQALDADGKIAAARGALAQHRQALAPLSEAESAADAALNERQHQARAAKAAWEAASARAAGARVALEGQVLVRDLVRSRERQAEVSVRLQKLAQLEQDLAERRTALAALLPVTREQAETLRGHEDQCARAQAAIEATSARLSVIEAGQSVQIGDRALEAGAVEVFAEATEIRVGENVRLALTPGGGTGLQQALRQRDALTRTRDDWRARLGVQGAAEAFEAAERCERMRADLAQLEARLADAGGEALRQEAQQLAEQVTTLEARIARQSQGTQASGDAAGTADAADAFDAAESAAADPPVSLAAAEAAVQAAEQAKDEAEGEEGDLANRRSLAEQAVEQAREAADAARLRARDLAARVAEGEQKLNWLLEQSGEDDARQRTLADLRAGRDQHAQRLEATQASLAGLQPELVVQDVARLDRALRAQAEASQQARAELNQAFGALGADGVSDPEADLSRARAAHERARTKAEAEQLRADAQLRLHALFSEKQQQLAQAYTRPLVQKATEYLRPVLGASTVMELAVEGTGFKDLQVYRADRADTAFSFDALSGGTREQVSAALRLAIAEVLAADHDGCLPVVFDDAFTNADPERIRQLQRMLDLAATRGLQVIVLTCTPRDYSRFGAREIAIARSTQSLIDK